MTRIELLTNSPAITGSTCVLQEHRGHGLATAIKVESLRALQQRGYTEARTHNDTANPSIMHINEKLGYKRIPGWTMWEKLL
jgi:GNAT superfamily N-acetyltransferase